MSNRVKVKIDGNHHEIVDAILAAGYAVQTLSQGMGVPDLLVADPTSQSLVLMEIKQPGEKLTEFQKKWAAKWPTPVLVAHTPQEALSGLLEVLGL